MRRRRQNGRAVRGGLLLLNFQFGGQNGRRGRRNWNVSGFGAAIAIKDLWRVASGHDFGERGERRAHNVHTADKFIGAAISKHLVDHQRLYLEGLWLAAPGKSESSGDVVNQQAVGLALLFHEFDQFGAKFRVGEFLTAFH